MCGGRADGWNGGWMSGLDGQVKDLLEPMMLGKPRTLTLEEQLTLATWAAMKSMVLEYVWGSEQVVVLPQGARTYVFRSARPRACRSGLLPWSPRAGQRSSSAAFISFSRRPPAAQRFLGLPRARPSSSAALSSRLTGPRSSPLPPRRTSTDAGIGHDVSWPPTELLDNGGLDRFAHPLQPIIGD